jgi:hypothetical protein
MGNKALQHRVWQRRFQTLTAACGIAMCCSQAAQATDADDTLSCQAKNYAVQAPSTQALSWPRQAPAQALDGACWISPSQLAERTASAASKPILLDIRPQAARQSGPIAHALQMNLSEVVHKRFLQPESLTLIGTGLDYAELTAACQQLWTQGFARVQALQGGAPGWQAFTGAAAARRLHLQSITASDWVGSLGQGIRWVMLSINDTVLRAPADRVPVPSQQIVPIPAAAQGDAATLASNLVRAYRDFSSARKGLSVPEAAIVVTDASFSDAQRLQTELAFATAGLTVTGPAIYWLQGGWQAYEQQVAQTAAVQKTASHKLQAPCGRI